MRLIEANEVSEKLKTMLLEEYPEEDIGIKDFDGNILGVIIPENIYKFLLEKIEEAEDEIDIQKAKMRQMDKEYQRE